MLEDLVSRKELNPKGHFLSPEQEVRAAWLHMAVNVLRYEYGKPFIITSGFRTPAEQKKINPKNMKSAHTLGAACDIYDHDGALWKWLMEHIALVEECGVYLESKNFTPTWVHMQVVAPKSGNRIFLP